MNAKMIYDHDGRQKNHDIKINCIHNKRGAFFIIHYIAKKVSNKVDCKRAYAGSCSSIQWKNSIEWKQKLDSKKSKNDTCKDNIRGCGCIFFCKLAKKSNCLHYALVNICFQLHLFSLIYLLFGKNSFIFNNTFVNGKW